MSSVQEPVIALPDADVLLPPCDLYSDEPPLKEDSKTPNVIIEVLSESKAAVDRGLKKQLYQNVLKIYDYFWFDPDSLEFAGFSLVSGQY
jgi:Uma2 family endonuclease